MRVWLWVTCALVIEGVAAYAAGWLSCAMQRDARDEWNLRAGDDPPWNWSVGAVDGVARDGFKHARRHRW